MLRKLGVPALVMSLGLAYAGLSSRVSTNDAPSEETSEVPDALSKPDVRPADLIAETYAPSGEKPAMAALSPESGLPADPRDAVSLSISQASRAAVHGTRPSPPPVVLPNPEEKKAILEGGLGVGAGVDRESQDKRLESFAETLEDPIREGLAFIGSATVNWGGRRIEVRSLLNFYNGLKHGETLADLKDACWSLQTRFEGLPGLNSFVYGAGCGRNVGLQDGRLYVYFEANEAALEPHATFIAFPLPDFTRSGDLRAYSPAKKKWEKLNDWSWRPISDHEFSQTESEVRNP